MQCLCAEMHKCHVLYRKEIRGEYYLIGRAKTNWCNLCWCASLAEMVPLTARKKPCEAGGVHGESADLAIWLRVLKVNVNEQVIGRIVTFIDL